MSDLIPCIEYDIKNNKCLSGHARLHSICRGVVTGCKSCGSGNVPMCMMDEQPRHLVRADGYPLNWPDREVQS